MRPSLLVTLAAILLGPCIAVAGNAPGSDRMVVHEWGTFTVLQDEQGKAVGGINTDDEPVPEFVHDLHGFLLQPKSEVPPVYFKGWPRCDRDVLVRLETPVIYFHPPAGMGPVKVDVEVSFNGGWLTQFYPDAKADAPGLIDTRRDVGKLNDKTIGRLAWHDLTIGGKAVPAPQTTDKVWLAPRKVDAADVATPSGESERFLFYRGVGHLKAPLEVSRSTDGKKLLIQVEPGESLTASHFDELWLLDVRADGTSAMRIIHSTKLANDTARSVAEAPADFAAADYSRETLGVMRSALRAALIHDGLFADEADGLLNTWDASYFRRPGLRLFFMSPAVWTQRVLPLKISQSAYIQRVMVGRIELMTPADRAQLAKIAAGPASMSDWLQPALAKVSNRTDFYRETWYAELMEGKKTMRDVKLEMPEDYRAYLSLGRFRNAMLLDEAARRPTKALDAFITNYGLAAGE